MNQNPPFGKTASIEGILLMLDGKTPHVAVPVQLMREEKTIETALSDDMGRYQFTKLKPGWYQVRCQILGGYVYYGEAGSIASPPPLAGPIHPRDRESVRVPGRRNPVASDDSHATSAIASAASSALRSAASIAAFLSFMMLIAKPDSSELSRLNSCNPERTASSRARVSPCRSRR